METELKIIAAHYYIHELNRNLTTLVQWDEDDFEGDELTEFINQNPEVIFFFL